ncbi:MAG: hypothetical protein QOD60_1592 [Solirubrobacterales bacterium]|jgi:hypothetical protein|nr:hypothetical protein [Solirubrobacterales bacterium]
MAIENRSARRKLVTASAAVAAIALAGITLAAPTAQASKSKSKPIIYTAKATAAGSWRATEDCGNFDHVVYQYGATFYPVDLGLISSLHYATSDLSAKTRTGGGNLDWDHTSPSCLPGGSPQSCPLGVETPPPGVHAGDEDGHFSQVKVGDPIGSGLASLVRGVKVTLVPPLTEEGSCSGGWISGWGGGGPTCPDPQGFINAKRIGSKSITVHIAGTCNTSEGGRTVVADTSGTLTLTRRAPKKH